MSRLMILLWLTICLAFCLITKMKIRSVRVKLLRPLETYRHLKQCKMVILFQVSRLLVIKAAASIITIPRDNISVRQEPSPILIKDFLTPKVQQNGDIILGQQLPIYLFLRAIFRNLHCVRRKYLYRGKNHTIFVYEKNKNFQNQKFFFKSSHFIYFCGNKNNFVTQWL